MNFYEDNRNRTALIEAACNKDHKSIRTLLDSGADVNCSTDTGLTSLMFAAYYHEWFPGNFSIKYLLKAGAHVKKINKFGQNVLQISVASNTIFYYKKEDYGDHYGKDVIMLLLAAGESIEEIKVDRISFYRNCDMTLAYRIICWNLNQIQLSLKWACREVIRKKLIQSDLFIRVPILRLPGQLHLYLLHDISVECKNTN